MLSVAIPTAFNTLIRILLNLILLLIHFLQMYCVVFFFFQWSVSRKLMEQGLLVFLALVTPMIQVVSFIFSFLVSFAILSVYIYRLYKSIFILTEHGCLYFFPFFWNFLLIVFIFAEQTSKITICYHFFFLPCFFF